MKVRITHLKAPWPLGARVGDVVAFADQPPAWAVGKCEEVDEHVQVTLEFGEPVKVELEADSVEVQSLKSEVAALTAKLEAADQTLQGHLQSAEVARAAMASADATIASLNEQVVDLTAKLEAAQAQAKTGKK